MPAGRPPIPFQDLVLKGLENDCWPWLGTLNEDGYGERWFNGKMSNSHRVAYQLEFGIISDSTIHVCHSCDNPACCNPKHLFLGSNADNVADRHSKGRSRGPVGEKNARYNRKLHQT